MVSNNQKPVAVLGGGMSGLAAALKLLEKGQKIILIEGSPQLGGVAVSVKIPEGRIVPMGYHQIVGSDKKLIEVLNKLNLMPQVKWKKTNVSALVDKKNINLTSPKDILMFDRIPISSRLKYLLFGARCLVTKDWSVWKNRTVTELMMKWTDKHILEEIFRPLVDIKFGFSTDEADAAWLGLRLSHGEGNTPFGYIPNTSWPYELSKKFKDKIETLGGKIYVNTSVKSLIINSNNIVESIIIKPNEPKSISRKIEIKAVLNTISAPNFNLILKSSTTPKKWVESIDKIEYISCYSLLAGVPFVPFIDYWTVALHPRRIFGGCFTISHLNETLITKKDKAVINLFTNVKLGNYPWSLEKYNQMALRDLEEATGRKVKFNWVQTNIIKFVSPVFNLGYKNPPARLGKNLYLAGIYRTYPKFSSTGEAMASGIESAEELLKNFS